MNTKEKICLLQGAFSPLFTFLSDELTKNGAEVIRVNFCAGDRLYSRYDKTSKIYDYTDMPCDWAEYVKMIFVTGKVDVVVGHGDCHFYNEVAFDVAKELGIKVVVTEEGYLRPHYITCEEGGVNAKSPLMNEDFSLDMEQEKLPTSRPMEVAASFKERSLWCANYYFTNWLFKDDYPFYKHRRKASICSEINAWLKTALITLRSKGKCDKVVKELVEENKEFYLVPLQVQCDSQIIKHSDYDGIENFISEVMESFSKYASKESVLVFKHHPYCLGFSDYTLVLEYFCNKYDIKDRVIYLKGGHLPSLLRSAEGVITVNSTVGLSSLHHGVPTYVAGRAFFNRTELTHQSGLDSFWSEKNRPDKAVVKNLFAKIHSRALLNASLYSNFEHSAKEIAKKILVISSK
ncbi:capsular biosynthesis protein [Vibrio sp. D431a]|uniref:capsular biosynthesis protein n=1 Tax=Vibrio sp. D431a TaxID=2837388 RepID=UPI002554AF15|nr:capsular biosynthesis protein [Vibrio sp. D431a]MDK9790723.1 capsular biosynthesis protein [Vibrio sp. D431a]